MNNIPENVDNFQRAVYVMARDPQFCTIAMYMLEMEIIADDKVGTAATDCVRKIWYSPKYFENMNIEECIAALVHEVYHKFLNFFPRFERWAARQDPKHSRKELLQTFNKAQDYFINWIIKHEWALPIQPGWLYNWEYKPERFTTESIASDLLNKPQPNTPPPPSSNAPEQGEGDGQGDSDDASGASTPDADTSDTSDDGDGDGTSGGSGDDDAPGDDDTNPADSSAGEGEDIVLPEEYDGSIDNVPDEADIQRMEIGNRAAAANADRMAKPVRKTGRSGGADPFTGAIADQNYKATHDWQTQLNRYANESAAEGTFTYSRPNNRRRTSQGMLYPTAVGKGLGTVVFAIDSSGSTSGGMVDYFLNEMELALEQAKFHKAVVIWCSEGIPQEGGVQEYTKHNISTLDKRIRRKGYGTEFSPVFDLVAEKYSDASVLTYLTDGGTDSYDLDYCEDVWRSKLRRMPVIWALADFGWSCTESLTIRANRSGFGVVAELPANAL